MFTLELPPSSPGGPGRRVPALPKQIHICGVKGHVENVAFLRCPPTARVKVPVPLLLSGADVCPGLKAGGTVNTMRRAALMSCPGNGVPTHLVADISSLAVGGKVTLADLDLPPRVSLAGKDPPSTPLYKIMGRVQRTAAEEAEDAADSGGGAAASGAAAGAGAAAASAAAVGKPAAK